MRQKLSAIQSEFNGRNVLLVDDSIVRGTTSTQIIAMAREAGAKKVYIASAAPPNRHPNVYGIDMPTKAELVATARDDAAIAAELGADRVIYQRLDDLKKSVSDEAAEQGVPFQGLDCSCFDGVYVTGLGGDYLTELAQKRGGAAAPRRRPRATSSTGWRCPPRARERAVSERARSRRGRAPRRRCILSNLLGWLAYLHLHGSSVGIELLGVREERTQRVRHRVDRSLPDLGRPEVRSVVPRDDALNEDAEVGALSQPRVPRARRGGARGAKRSDAPRAEHVIGEQSGERLGLAAPSAAAASRPAARRRR